MKSKRVIMDITVRAELTGLRRENLKLAAAIQKAETENAELRARLKALRKAGHHHLTVVDRAPVERMQVIHEKLRARRYPNKTTLANEMEVGVRTIGRDVEFMRDRLRLPIAYDRKRNGFYYEAKAEAVFTHA